MGKGRRSLGKGTWEEGKPPLPCRVGSSGLWEERGLKPKGFIGGGGLWTRELSKTGQVRGWGESGETKHRAPIEVNRSNLLLMDAPL